MKRKSMYTREAENRGWPGVRVEVGKHDKFFSYAKYGKTEARRLAQAFAAKHADRTRVNPDTGREIKKGVSGIFRVVRMVAQRNGKKVRSVRWVCQWQEKPGQNKRREFSVGKYGEAGAKDAAKAHRKAMVKRILA